MSDVDKHLKDIEELESLIRKKKTGSPPKKEPDDQSDKKKQQDAYDEAMKGI